VPQQHRPLSLNTGKGRDAAGGMGSGWPGGGCTPAQHSLCWGPFPSTKDCQYLPELLFDRDSSQARLGTDRPAAGGAAVSSPHLPIPAHLALLPCSLPRQCWPSTQKHSGRNHSEGLCPYPKYSLLAA